MRPDAPTSLAVAIAGAVTAIGAGPNSTESSNRIIVPVVGTLA